MWQPLHKIIYAWYCKPGWKLMAMAIKGTKREIITNTLINGHLVKVLSNYVFAPVD